MVAVFEQYTEEMRRHFGYFACWLPNTRLELGDVGFLSRDRFDKVTALAQLGVDFERRAAGDPVDLEYSSAGQVDVSVNAGAEFDAAAATEQSANLSVMFDRAHATYFQAAGCTIEEVLDLPRLEADLLRLSRQGEWRLGYVVVTELIRSGSATILISKEKGAKAEFGVRADALGAAALTSAGLSTRSVSGLAVKVVAQAGVTPLFRAVHLRRRLVAEPQLVYRGEEPKADRAIAGDLALAQVNWHDVPPRPAPR